MNSILLTTRKQINGYCGDLGLNSYFVEMGRIKGREGIRSCRVGGEGEIFEIRRVGLFENRTSLINTYGPM